MFAFSTNYALNASRYSRVLRSPVRRATHKSLRIQPHANISREQVEKTARLANLALSEDEIAKVTPEFQKILDFVDKMSTLDISDIEPMARPHATHNVVREDCPKLFSDVDAIMGEVPSVEKDYVRVPRITSEGAE